LRNGLTLLIVAIIGVLVALAVADALRSDPAASVAATAPPAGTSRSAPAPPALFPFGSKSGAIEEIGNAWAALYAAGDPKVCTHMLKPLCRVEPTHAFRASFRRATVQDIRFRNDHDAGVSFSNGVIVEFWGDGGTWKVRTVVANAFDFQ
jgi:hypothetical protein